MLRPRPPLASLGSCLQTSKSKTRVMGFSITSHPSQWKWWGGVKLLLNGSFKHKNGNTAATAFKVEYDVVFNWQSVRCVNAQKHI
jgi:hypothetical protein